MPRWKIALLVFSVFSVGLYFRTYRLTELPPGLYPDEAMNGSNALEAIRTGDYKLYYPENNGREALFINIQAQSLRFFMPRNGGLPEPWMLRIVSAIFGSLTVLGMYVLGRELLSRYAGLLASFFLATSFWHINFSRIGFRAIMAPFCLVWATALFLIALRLIRDRKTVTALLLALLGGLVFGAGFHSYIAYRVAPLLFLLFVPWYFHDKGFWKITAVFLLGTIVAGLPIGLYYLEHPADFLGRTSQVSIFSTENPLGTLARNTVLTIGMFFVAGDFNPRHNIPGQPEFFAPVAFLFLLGVALGIRALFLKTSSPAEPSDDLPFIPRRLSMLVLFAWLFLTALPVVISSEGLPHALRAILMIPPALLFAAYAGEHLWRRYGARVPQHLTVVFAGFFVAVLIAEANSSYFSRFANHPDTPDAFAANYAEIAREIRMLDRNVPKYVVVEAGGVDVRGFPMPTQTVMFMTDTFTPDKRQEKNVSYILPQEAGRVPENARVFYLR